MQQYASCCSISPAVLCTYGVPEQTFPFVLTCRTPQRNEITAATPVSSAFWENCESRCCSQCPLPKVSGCCCGFPSSLGSSPSTLQSQGQPVLHYWDSLGRAQGPEVPGSTRDRSHNSKFRLYHHTQEVQPIFNREKQISFTDINHFLKVSADSSKIHLLHCGCCYQHERQLL